ncbi:MAG: flagellar biosynthetic protein FliR [Candidatus Gastranaerophilales bacterium]|nr:flagellar biosynthetic protein FliR [Candidatus Gastranaerophilales bacterium]
MPVDLITLLSPKNLVIFVIVFTRLTGLMMSAPLISKYPIPFQIKAWFVTMISFIIFPIVLANVNFAMPTTIPELTLILIREFMIGYIVGFVANIIFIAVEISAELVSMQMGLTAAQALNPTTGDTAPILSHVYTIMASMIFIGINGYQWVFSGLYKSFFLMPPGYSFIVTGNMAHNVMWVSNQIFIIGLGLALPIFSVLLLTDVLLGFVAKMMPKMNIFMVALPAKIYIGLSIFIMLTPQIVSKIEILLKDYLTGIISVLGG